MDVVNTIGRRKSAVARIFVREGKGNILINGKDYKNYFPTQVLQYEVERPLVLVNAIEKYDIQVSVDGGGVNGQAQAVKMAIARAVVTINGEDRKVIKANGLLTRDAREVERKKPGHPKARKRFQFSKR